MAKRIAPALLAIAASLATGCLGPETDRASSSWFSKFRPEIGPEAIVMDLALVERKLGDPFLNRGLWQHADQLIVDLERKSVLEENGLRVGQLVGLTPGELQNLLKSEWCTTPRRRILPAGQADTHYLGPLQAHTEYDVNLGGASSDVVVDQARFALEVTANHTSDGRTKIKLVPKVETGEQVLPFQPAPDLSNWVYKVERSARRYPELSWEVTLKPNEFLIVGPQLDRKSSLGYRALVQDDGPAPVQRLLVIRTARAGTNREGEPSLEDIARSSSSPPLALQATMGAVRASRP